MSPDLPAAPSLASVATRNPGIPGFAVALDPARVAALAVAGGVLSDGAVAIGPDRRDGGVGGGAVSYEVSRLRLKRDRSLSVALRPVSGAGPWLLARAVRSEDWATKAAKDLVAAERRGLPSAACAECSLLVVPAAADRHLALDRLAREGVRLGDPPPGSERRELLPGHAPAILDVARTLSYNPSRRWVGLAPAGRGDGPRRLLRLHAGRPRPEVEPYVEGTPLATPASGPTPGPADAPTGGLAAFPSGWAEELAEALAAELAARGEPPRSPRADLTDALDRVATSLADLDPGWGQRVGPLVQRLVSSREALRPQAPAHGDLSPDQVIRGDDDRLHLIDWDRWGWWPRGWDSATWTAQAVLDGAATPGTCSALLGKRPAPTVLAAAALLRSPDAFRRLRHDWPAATLRLLEHAEAVLG